MKIFSLGFIITFISLAFAFHIKLDVMKVYFEQLLIIIPAVITISFFCWESIKFILIMCKHKKQVIDNLTTNWKCLLINGPWGSGKTTHYQKYYQYIDDVPNIDISCFSASRSELIAQIIQQQFWCKLLTLNGLFAKLMESNWQIFMPKNRVVVFDDLERLHANQENYLDLIGIVDHLKNKNECKIILICNMLELKEPIFNTYMERIVDSVELVTKLPDLSELFKNPKDKHHYKNVDLNSPIVQKTISSCQDMYDDNKLKNLRVFKASISDFANNLNRQYPESINWDNKRQVIYAETFANELIKNISVRYLFFADYQLFNEVRSFIAKQKAQNEIASDVQKISQNELQQRLENKLDLCHKALKLNDFQYDENKMSPLPMINFNEEKCVVFALENVPTLAELKPEYVWAINQNIGTIIHSLTFKQAKKFIQIGSYKDQYNSSLLQEWKEYITQYVKNYQNQIHLFHSFSTENRHNYIEDFALAILFRKLSLKDHFDKSIDFIAIKLRMGEIPFDKVVSSREFFWEENGITFDKPSKKYKYTENNPNEKGISFKMHVMALILERYIYWFIDDDIDCSNILKELNLHYRNVLNIVETRRTTCEYVYDGDNPSVNIRI